MKPNLDSAISIEALDLEYAFDYGFSMSSRQIIINGTIDEDSFLEFDAKLTKLEHQSTKQVVVKINSEGGFPDSALAIVGRMKESKCQIITKGYGLVASAATLVLAAGSRREMSRFCTLMIHEASYGHEGKHSDTKAFMQEMERQERMWSEYFSEFSNKSASYWYDLVTGKDIYFTPAQCLEHGIVDKVF